VSEQYTTANSDRKKSPSFRIICLIVVLVLIIVGIALFFFLRGTPATDIIFYEKAVEVTTGNTLKLNYEILPQDTTNKSVKWESSNPSVAEISNTGEVIAIREGQSVITVTTANGRIDECLVTVKPTAFDYLKKLGSSAEGYTVGNYQTSNGATSAIGIYYLDEKDALYIMETAEGDAGNGCRYSITSSIAIPVSLSGEYEGYLEFDYGFDKKFEPRIVHTTYLLDASALTSNTGLKSFSCDGTSYQISENEAIYTSSCHAMLAKVYQEILEPNGYTYADLGFISYS